VIANAGPRGVAWWAGQVKAEGWVSDTLAAEMAAQPRFNDAVRAHLRGTLAMQASNPMVLRLANDGVRLLLAYLALYMDARDGLTRQAVRDLFGGIGLASPGRATAILMQLRLIKFIEPAAEQPDRRTKRYVPTAAMKTAFVELMTMGIEATALIEPDAAGFIPQFAAPAFFKGYALALGESMLTMLRRLEGLPRNMFTDATAGHLMLYRLVIGSQEAEYPPRGALPFAASPLAREFKVARSHVRRTFDRAAALALIRYGEGGRSIVLSEPFRTQLVNLHAAMFVNNLRCLWSAQDYAHGAGEAAPA
jgi:hypothetical protein